MIQITFILYFPLLITLIGSKLIQNISWLKEVQKRLELFSIQLERDRHQYSHVYHDSGLHFPSSVSHRERSSTSRIPRTAMSEAVEKRVFLTNISQPTKLLLLGFFSVRELGIFG